MDYPIQPILSRYIRDHQVSPDEASRRGRELKRYLLLCASHPEQSYPIGPALDDLWHTFLLFTREYHEFCGVLGVFIHHAPHDATSRDAVSSLRSLQVLRMQYHAMFGEDPPADLWPTGVGQSMADCTAPQGVPGQVADCDSSGERLTLAYSHSAHS
jgi:hypothetical protein